MFVDFKEVRVVHDGVNRVFDVVGLLRIVGDERVERFIATVNGIGRGAARRVVDVIGGKKAEQFANHSEAIGVVWCDEVRDARGGVVGHGAAEFLLGDFLVCDGFDDVWPSDKHVGSVPRHENKIGDGGGIHGAARAGGPESAVLSNEAACQTIEGKNV